MCELIHIRALPRNRNPAAACLFRGIDSSRGILPLVNALLAQQRATYRPTMQADNCHPATSREIMRKRVKPTQSKSSSKRARTKSKPSLNRGRATPKSKRTTASLAKLNFNQS
jgi:hypothetical protein